jgi:hypothetical protein
MTVNAPNPGIYQAQLGAHCVALREALQDLINDAEYLASMGGVTFLEAAPFSLSAADAQTIMSTVGAVLPTNGTVAALQTFITSTQPLWGGN